MIKQLNLSVTRGCTLASGKLIEVSEVVPANITYAQLLAGITAGTYTKKSLSGKTFKGQVRDRANAHLRGDLVFDTTNDELSFSLAAEFTAEWPNESNTYFYDVLETTTATGLVRKRVEGKITVSPSITLEEV